MSDASEPGCGSRKPRPQMDQKEVRRAMEARRDAENRKWQVHLAPDELAALSRGTRKLYERLAKQGLEFVVLSHQFDPPTGGLAAQIRHDALEKWRRKVTRAREQIDDLTVELKSRPDFSASLLASLNQQLQKIDARFVSRTGPKDLA